MASKSKKRQSQAVDESDDGFIDDSDDHSRPKKARTEVKPSSTNCSDNKTLRTLSGGAGKIDSNGDVYWEISRLRRVTVSSFKGRTMVNIREYYEKDGNELPGKKGISMPVDQFATLVSLLPEIESALSKKGESLPRPDYSRTASEPRDKGDIDRGRNADHGGPQETQRNATLAKKNIEATSEEDE
ncbi:putative RNA polymerase II transcriptional coactivator [Thermoascus aurantiacus ATCC 26904]